MAKPKTLYLSEHDRSGIDVTYIKSANSIRIGGWYDGCIGISSVEITLADLFSKLGITEKDCRQAFSLLSKQEFKKYD